MKVLYDHQAFSLQDFGGVTLIYSELLRAFQNYPKNVISAKAFAPASGNVNLQSAQPQLSWKILHKISNQNRFKLQFQVNKLLSLISLATSNFDVYHPTYYNPYFIPHVKKPFVVTVYDMAHEVFADDPAFNADVRKNKQILVQAASKVLAISQFVKDDLIRIYNVPADKIEVTYLGGDNILRPEDQDAGNFASILPKRYIVYDGTRKSGYKNFRPFLSAIAPILNKDTTLYVVCAGGVPFTADEIAFFTELKIEKQLINVPVRGTMPMQAVFWKNALLFAYPSLYEGFGIPFVQSMFCGCPIVGSNTGSTAEVGQDVIFYFDGKNQESIRATVENALYNEEERKKKIALGYARAKDFTWQKTAEKTLAVYQSLL